VQLGVERNVLIESTRHSGREGCHIDHHPRDNFTEKFFLSQTGSTAPRMERAYFDDIYSLIDAVAHGVGRAVVPVHLLEPESGIRAVRVFPLTTCLFSCISIASLTIPGCSKASSTRCDSNALLC